MGDEFHLVSLYENWQKAIQEAQQREQAEKELERLRGIRDTTDLLRKQLKDTQAELKDCKCFLREATDCLSEKKTQPEIVYVHGLTVWDWLSEREWPKVKVSLNVVAVILSVLFIIGDIFFIHWFHHFGTEWAEAPVGVSGIILGFIAFAIGLWQLVITIDI